MSSLLKDDPAWVIRMEKYFDIIDKDCKGVISIDKIQQWATNMELLCDPTPNEMVRLRATLYTFWEEIGLKPHVFMTKTQFIEGVHRLSEVEVGKSKNGYVMLLDDVNDAFFDIIDRDKNNILTLEELRYVMLAATRKVKDVDRWMKQADADENGVIAREEFFDSERKFWYKIS